MDDREKLALTSSGRPIHIPVMCDRIGDYLASSLSSSEPSIYVDLTLGMGGHAFAFLTRFPNASLIGFDHDSHALEIARRHLEPFGQRVRLVRARFDQCGSILDQMGCTIDGALADLGLSSLQIDDEERGFSYSKDTPLDMRMDDRCTVSASDIVNSYTASDLASVFTRYAQQPAAKRIAAAIVAARSKTSIKTSQQLVDIIVDALPAAMRYSKQGGGHPAKKIFQALRIEVNGELDALTRMLPDVMNHLNKGGRFAVLSYHSGEDRLVKQAFQEACRDRAPHKMPLIPESYRAHYALCTKGAERPDEDQVTANPRAASAKLRVIERIADREGER